MNKKILWWVLVLLILVEGVLAIGIAPAKTTVVFEESRDYIGQFWIVNNEGREFSVSLHVDGEMKSFVELKTTQAEILRSDASKPIEFEVHLPEEVPPGTTLANIIVEEKLESNDPNVISAKLVLKHKIIVQGPYPDKYIEAKLNFHEDKEIIKMISEVENKGRLDLEEVKTTFLVDDREQQTHELETQTETLARTENKLLYAQADRDLFEQGEFDVSALITYDDQELRLVKTMHIGRPEIDITYFDKYFIANKVNQYSMELLNKWNKEIKNVFVDVEVKKHDARIDEFRTKSVDIDGEKSEQIVDYFDARDKDVGLYSFEMVVNFWNNYRMEEKVFSSEFISEEEAASLGISGAAVTNSSGSSSLIMTLGAIMVLLVLVIIGLIVVRNKRGPQ